MKKIKKIMIILIAVLVLFSAVVYIDYFVVVKRTSYPKISLKKQLDENLIGIQIYWFQFENSCTLIERP